MTLQEFKVNFAIMNSKDEWEDLKMEHLTIAKSGITLGKLLNILKSEVFEIHFPGHESDGYICGDLATGEVLLKILKDDVLNSEVIEAHLEAYGDDFAGMSVTVDYDLDKEVNK